MSKLLVRNRYGVVPHKILNSPALSFKAKGLFAYIQSKPGGWEFSVERIENQTKEGRESVASGLKELETLGYLVRTPAKNAQGEWSGYDYELSEQPFAETDAGEPFTENPLTVNPSTLSKQEFSNKENLKESGEVNPYGIGPESQQALQAKKDAKKANKGKWGSFQRKPIRQVEPPPPSLYSSVSSVTETDITEVAKATKTEVGDVTNIWETIKSKARAGELKTNNFKEKLFQYVLNAKTNGWIEEKKTLRELIEEQYGPIDE